MPVKIDVKQTRKWNVENDVQKYEQEQVEPGQIVFYGPSNFTRWERERWGHVPLREAIVGKSGAPCCVNRGFGTSCAEHQLYYYHRLVKPLAPGVLVYSVSYGNGKMFGYTLEENWELSQRVIRYALADFPDLRVYIVGSGAYRDMTPANLPEKELYNSWIKEFVESTPGCIYVDVLSHLPLHNKEIYVEDGIHFNQQGYDIYADFFREVLRDELAKF